MRIRLSNCEILDPETGDRFWGYVEIEGENVIEVGRSGPGLSGTAAPETKIIDTRGLLVTCSFVDLFADFCEPGFEHREDIGTGSRAAAAGGYTRVFVTPETDPVCDSADTVRLIMQRAKEVGLVDVLPHGATSRELGGQKLSDVGEMAEAGIMTLSAGDGYEADAGFLRRVMEYAKNFGLKMVLTCEDPGLARGGLVHEDFVATLTGLAGIPVAAEEIAVARHIALSELTGVHVHLAKLSSAAAVGMVREAQARGVPVSASTTALHLFLTVSAVLDYDANARLRPPLRSSEDREALVAAVEDGTIAVVVSDHRPRARQEKEVEFDRALPGASSIEMTFSILNTLVARGELSLLAALRALSSGPRRVVGLPPARIAPGEPADLVILDRAMEWTPSDKAMVSRSTNTPLLGTRLVGRPVLTIKQGRVTWDLLGLSRV